MPRSYVKEAEFIVSVFFRFHKPSRLLRSTYTTLPSSNNRLTLSTISGENRFADLESMSESPFLLPASTRAVNWKMRTFCLLNTPSPGTSAQFEIFDNHVEIINP